MAHWQFNALMLVLWVIIGIPAFTYAGRNFRECVKYIAFAHRSFWGLAWQVVLSVILVRCVTSMAAFYVCELVTGGRY